MPVFPLLADPHHYRACETDLLLDADARQYWIDLFKAHIDVNLEAARSVGIAAESCDAARHDLHALLERTRATPDLHGRLDILKLDELRQVILTRHGIIDEFRLIKQRENEASFALLPDYLESLDAMDEDRRLATIITGMLAGNFFDMGVKVTSEAYGTGRVSFDDALAKVPDRPWLYDDLDRAVEDLADHPPHSVVIFADNAGADCVLGVLPLARELLQRGARVAIAANHRPVLNDITVDEFIELRRRAVAVDPLYRSNDLSIIPSGNIQPLIDLTAVSAELVNVARDADLVVLVGMGRALESNFNAAFTCRSWRVAMVKDDQVARTVHGSMFDAVFSMRQGMSPHHD